MEISHGYGSGYHIFSFNNKNISQRIYEKELADVDDPIHYGYAPGTEAYRKQAEEEKEYYKNVKKIQREETSVVCPICEGKVVIRDREVRK